MHPGPMNRASRSTRGSPTPTRRSIAEQVRSGLVVRWPCSTTCSRAGAASRSPRGAARSRDRLFWRDGPATASRSAAPASSIPRRHRRAADVTIEDGVITASSPPPSRPRGLVLAPAFVDPHVHLRTPAARTRRRSPGNGGGSGGRVLRHPRDAEHRPGRRHGRRARGPDRAGPDEAAIPTGFMAAISKGLRGEELTEMAELARLGAAAFTDDGKPVASAGLMQRALLQRRHGQDPRPARGGADPLARRADARRRRLGRARAGGWPSVAESVMIERDCTLAAYEQRPCI